MTHIENIPHILQYGITHSKSNFSNPDFRSIGDSSLISTRNSFTLDNGRLLGEYIPFYFGLRTPMLFVMQKGYNRLTSIPPEDIVYCVSSIQKIMDLNLDFVFTDGHAVDGFSSQYSNADIKDVDSLIDWSAVKAKYWKDEKDLDLKRRKEAEFLVLGDIALQAILGYVVYNEKAKKKLMAYGIVPAQVHVSMDYYF